MNPDHQDEELTALLAALPQPSPSAELDAAILADAEQALVTPVAKPLAANDSGDGVVRTLPAKKTTDYLTRWRLPLGLAAAVLLTFNLVGGDFFGHKQATYPVVGEPLDPPVATSVAPSADQMESKAEPSGTVRPAPSVRRAMTLPPPPAPSAAEPMPAPPKLDASVWLVKIDGLLKAGQKPAAQQEWAAFKQAYPDYPVEKQLQQKLEP
ncbi:hypothetical protein [Janthinobacterium psychrotolerans]|uniref:Uncharacterized protein n=1 Tax=Janthinobacterium psychrotolerans TaxID=1747903 RepID=A0A1A7C3D6_9BURK|nr:hypothetical protein [Janthinobacterium psychrotolerans]OBV40466.1 hypothetical protein ASR47_101690 [Janthinobacterium psychrotolerans]